MNLDPNIGYTLYPQAPPPSTAGMIRQRYHQLLHRVTPPTRYAITGSLAILMLIVSAASYHTLWFYTDSPLQITIEHVQSPAKVRLPILLDYEGVAFVLAGLATPIFCSTQLLLIRGILPSNEANSAWLTSGSGVTASPSDTVVLPLNDIIVTANRRFGYLRGRLTSALLAAASAAITFGMYRIVDRMGPLAAWNPTNLPRAEWRAKAYEGWWGNPHNYPVNAALLFLIGTYFVYFLLKQLIMGLIFAQYAYQSWRRNLSIIPNVDINEDGFWGLTTLRRVLAVTYASSIVHFLAVMGMFWVWLPFMQTTVFIVLTVGLFNAATVIFPSVLAHSSIIMMKRAYVSRLVVNSGTPPALIPAPSWPPPAIQARIDSVWAASNLPFRTRNSVAAIAAYFVAPLILAVFSALVLPSK